MTTTREIIPNGIHFGLNAKRYHAAFGVSNSDLKVFVQGPNIYKAKRDGVPLKDDDDSEEETKAQTMGSLLHLEVLEPQKFGKDLSHYVKPDAYTSEKGETKPWNGNANVCKAWKEDHSHLPIISAIEHRRVVGARASIMAHPAAGPLFAGVGQNEVSIIAPHAGTGLTLRMRADRLTPDAHGNTWIIDIKSCPDVDKFYFSARRYRHNIQIASYEEIAKLGGVENPIGCIVAVELKPIHGVHRVRVISLDEDSRRDALNVWERDLAAFAVCEATGNWPAGGPRIQTLTVSTRFQ